MEVDFGIWICLIATTVANIIQEQSNFILQNRKLRVTASKEDIIIKSREAIIKSIDHGMIKDPRGNPFRHIRLERDNKRESQKRSETKVGKSEQE